MSSSVISLFKYFNTILVSLTELFGFFNFSNFYFSWFLNRSWSFSLIYSVTLLIPNNANFKFLLSFGSYSTNFYKVLTFFIGFFFFSYCFFASSRFASFSSLPFNFSEIFYLLSTGNSLRMVPSSYKLIPALTLKLGFFPNKFIS